MKLDKNKTLLVIANKYELQENSVSFFPNVLYTGIGKINAAMSLSSYLGKQSVIGFLNAKKKDREEGFVRNLLNFNLILNLGTAGKIKKIQFDLVQITSFYQADMDATDLGCKKYQTPFEEDVIIFDAIFKNLFKVSCGTADKFITNNDKEAPYDIVDMEAYALAKVCKRYGIPFSSVKYITDSANHLAKDDWINALTKTQIKLKGFLNTVFS